MLRKGCANGHSQQLRVSLSQMRLLWKVGGFASPAAKVFPLREELPSFLSPSGCDYVGSKILLMCKSSKRATPSLPSPSGNRSNAPRQLLCESHAIPATGASLPSLPRIALRRLPSLPRAGDELTVRLVSDADASSQPSDERAACEETQGVAANRIDVGAEGGKESPIELEGSEKSWNRGGMMGVEMMRS